MVPNCRSVVEAGIEYVPWYDIPCTYVICEKDKTLPPETARWVLQSAGGKCDIMQIESGHSPFLSMPERTAAIVRAVAGEEGVDLSGLKFGDDAEGGAQASWAAAS